MPRPIWTGTLSFGLLNVPVALMSGERRIDLHFRMLDSRNNAPVRYERVNAETGEEVAWKDIVKAFEYDKGSYVVLEADDIKAAAPESHESIDVEAFIDATAIGPQYFEKPYILVPGKKAEKGYVLLRETLAATGKIGIARVVIRTREYLSAVMPQGKALVLILLRFPQELVDAEDYALPAAETDAYRISAQEMKMAAQLIESMSGVWKPGDFRDEFRERLTKVIEDRMKSEGVVKRVDNAEDNTPEGAATNVVDFMSLLEQSLSTKKRTPAKKAVEKVVATKKPTKVAKKSAKTAREPVAAKQPTPAAKKTRKAG